MQLPFRAAFAALLWGVAVFPPVLFVVHLGSPVAAVQLAQGIGTAARWTTLAGGGLFVAGLLIYPPFLPSLRMGLRNVRMRLGTDLGPLREAQARLQHFETAADHLVAGRALLQQGKLGDSVVHLTRAVELDPEHAASRYQLGLALTKIGNLQAAADQLGWVVQHDPGHAFGAAMLELGVVLERGEAATQAVHVLERHEAEFGSNRRNLFHRARAHQTNGDREKALADLRAAAQPPEQGRKLTLDDELMRAKARMALLRGRA